MRKGLIATALLASVAILAFTTPSHSALISCPADFTQDGTAKVNDGSASLLTAASACQYDDATDQSDVANIGQINTSGFFGINTWESNGQDQLEGAGSIGQSGTWDILNYDFDLYDYLIVFKDGAGTSLTAFLFNELFSSGDWLTPFENPPFSSVGEPHDVSHLTIARTLDENGPGPGPGPIPEPGTLAVMGAALTGLWALGRRRKPKA